MKKYNQIVTKKTTEIIKITLLTIFIITAGIALITSLGCNGGGSDSDDNSAPNPSPVGTGTSLNLNFQEGNFWEFFWTNEKSTFSQPDNTDSDVSVGTFRITLGASVTIDSQTAYPINITGETGDGTINFFRNWTHLALGSDGSLLGSMDGVSLQVVFNAQTDNWVGGGFFIEFDDTENINFTSGTFMGNYNQLNAFIAAHEENSGGCEVVLGQTFCDDESTTFSEKEYYKDGIGPIGYILNITYSSSGGGFYTSTTIERTVELINTSFSAADGSTFNPPPWEEIAELNTPRYRHTAVVLDEKIYVLGGLDKNGTTLTSVEIYDPNINSWSFGTPIPATTYCATAEVIDNKIYLISCVENEVVRIFDPNTGWSSGTGTPYDDPSHDSVTYNDATFGDTIAIITPDGALNSRLYVFAYQPSGDQWLTGNPLTTSDCRWFTVNLISNTLYVTGGYVASTSTAFNRARRYDLSTDTWLSNTGAMNLARYDHASVVLDGEIFILGGRGSAGGRIFNEVEAYDPATNTWTEITPMFQPRKEFDAVVLNGLLYAIGGSAGDEVTGKVERFTP